MIVEDEDDDDEDEDDDDDDDDDFGLRDLLHLEDSRMHCFHARRP